MFSHAGAVKAKAINYEYGLECRASNQCKRKTSELKSQVHCIADEILADVEGALKSAKVKTSNHRYYAGGRKGKKK